MYVFLGWLNIVLIVVMTSPFWLRFLNDRILHLKGGSFASTIKLLRKIHKPLGAVLIISGLVHGYLAMGGFRLHTGTLVWLSIVVTAVLGMSFYMTKNKSLFVWHKRMVLIVLFFLFIHRIFPNALSFLLN